MAREWNNEEEVCTESEEESTVKEFSWTRVRR
jgi:hypothetical protein